MINPSDQTIEIWGRATSSNVQTVMWAAAELKLEVARFDVGGAFGGTDSEQYRSMNPMGLVPALRDGDLTLFESAAIVRYLGARYGSHDFWPNDIARRAELDQWAEWSKTSLYPVLIKGVFWQLVRTPSAQRDPAMIEQHSQELKSLMTAVTRRLGDDDYLGGAQLCFADILFGHLLYRYFALDIKRAKLPTLRAYYDRLTAREAYKEHVMVDYSDLQVD